MRVRRAAGHPPGHTPGAGLVRESCRPPGPVFPVSTSGAGLLALRYGSPPGGWTGLVAGARGGPPRGFPVRRARPSRVPPATSRPGRTGGGQAAQPLGGTAGPGPHGRGYLGEVPAVGQFRASGIRPDRPQDAG